MGKRSSKTQSINTSGGGNSALQVAERGKAKVDDWCELADEAEKLHQHFPETRCQWDSTRSPVIRRGVYIPERICREGYEQAVSRYTTPGSHCGVYGDPEGSKQFDKIARRVAILSGCEEIKGEKARDWLIYLLKNYFLKQDRGLKERIGFVGDHEGVVIEYLFKAVELYSCEMASQAPAGNTIGEMEPQPEQDSERNLTKGQKTLEHHARLQEQVDDSSRKELGTEELEQADPDGQLEPPASNEQIEQAVEDSLDGDLFQVLQLKVFEKRGDTWQVTYAGQTLYFSNLKGFRYLKYLLERPKESIPSYIVETLGHRPKTSKEGILLTKMSSGQLEDQESMTPRSNLEFAQPDLGKMTDPESLKRARVELKKIEDELNGLQWSDPERPIYEKDAEKIKSYINSVTGMHGKIRDFTNQEDQARKNVSKAIKRAIEKIQKELPGLAAFLNSFVKPGRECSYTPPAPPS